MRRKYRSILKWFILAGLVIIFFKICCDSLVDIALSSSSSARGNIPKKNSELHYEDSLIAWADTGQHFNNDKLAMKNIKDRSDLQLIGAQIFFRHGARTPITLLSSLEEVVYSKEQIEHYLLSKWDIKLITKRGNMIVSQENLTSANDIDGRGLQELKSASGEKVRIGQLTAVGEKQLFQLGRLVRSQLIDNSNEHGLLPATYNPKYVYCRSTFMNRTISSARSFLAGLFSSDNTDNKVQANGPFEIEVHPLSDEDLFPNTNLSPSLKKCHSVRSLYMSLNDGHDLKKARQAFINRLGFAESPHGIIELHDEIVSRQAHNFSVPKDLLDLAKDFEVMSAREYVYRATNIGLDVFIRSSCGSILSLIRDNFDAILKNYLEEKKNQIKKSYQKLFIYSGHDSTLIPLAIALEIFNMRWPQYATYIFMKYFISTTNPNETYIAVNYAGEPQILPNCYDYYCSYSTFLKNLQNRFDQRKQSVQQ